MLHQLMYFKKQMDKDTYIFLVQLQYKNSPNYVAIRVFNIQNLLVMTCNNRVEYFYFLNAKAHIGYQEVLEKPLKLNCITS